jgi:hypothetical protein
MVGITGIAAQPAGRKDNNMNKDNIEQPEGNIFNSPMDMRDWAVKLIGYLGRADNLELPNMMKVQKLVEQFVNDYNYYYQKLQEEE